MSERWNREYNNPNVVIGYLEENYSADNDGASIGKEMAQRLVEKHAEEVEKGMAYRSHASYIGDVIATDESLIWMGKDEDDEDDDEYDPDWDLD